MSELEKVTIAYTYYNKMTMFESVRDYYTAMELPHVKFMICDDGSQEKPLTDNDVPDDWGWLQVTEDIGWNNEGARNLIMKEAETDWVVLLDLDHLLFPYVAQQIHNIAHLDKDKAPFHERQFNIQSKMMQPAMNLDLSGGLTPYPPHKIVSANSFAIHKEHFWKLGGYDEAFSGMYGYDMTLVRQLGNKNPDRFTCGMLGFTLGGGGSTWTREQKDKSMVETRKIRTQRRGLNMPGERIRFPWKRIR